MKTADLRKLLRELKARGDVLGAARTALLLACVREAAGDLDEARAP